MSSTSMKILACCGGRRDTARTDNLAGFSRDERVGLLGVRSAFSAWLLLANLVWITYERTYKFLKLIHEFSHYGGLLWLSLSRILS